MEERKKITFDEAVERGFIVVCVDGVRNMLDELKYLEIPHHPAANKDELIDLLYSMQSEEYDVDDDLYIILDEDRVNEELEKEYVLLLENGKMIRENEDNLFELRYAAEDKADVAPQMLSNDDYDDYVESIHCFIREKKVLDIEELAKKVEEAIDEILENKEKEL